MNLIPQSLNEKIKKDIYERLHPNLALLVAKVLFIHFSTAIITLSVCPQFGFKLFQLPINLMNSFMVFGMPFCNFMCGIFFTATSIALSAIILPRDSLQAIKNNRILTVSTLLLSSIGFFGIMNPDLFVNFSLMWLLGAVAGILGTLKLSTRLLLQA
jgi:hypothetical protein